MARPLSRGIVCLAKMKECLIIPSSFQLFSSSSSNTIVSSLAAKLLKVPLSRIKETLDFEGEKNRYSTLETQDFSWDALVTALMSSSSPKKANLVVEWRLEKSVNEKDKNREFFKGLIVLCGKVQNVETALRVFSVMEAQGLKPTSSVFNALVSVCLSSDNLVTALSLYELMEISEDYKPDSDTYIAFISAYANLGNKKAMQAWYSARMAAGFSPTVQTYDALILGCVKSKNLVDAVRFYEEMTLAGFLPNLSILQNMLIVYCEQRNFDKIKEFMMFVLDGSCIINGHIAEKVVALYYEMARVEEMEELLVAFSTSDQATEILSLVHNVIIRMHVRADGLDNVEYSVGRMLKQGISFRCPDDIEKVICLYFRKAAYERLDLFLECIKDSCELRRSTYDLLVAGYRRAGLQEKLDLVINDMKQNGFIIS
ncbi:hypothetical protein ACH5RR_041126 [Cinchona calisaya]|uniref:Pentatricopeptide repeat-containing protein n=1 Tax=Cinchona calisaya TaxID=153742 RepID=A0ABD2XYM8_9GENT